MMSAAEKLGLWKRDPRPHGWTGNSFGPLPVTKVEERRRKNVAEMRAEVEAAFARGVEASAPKPEPAPEQQAAAKLLGDARRAESRAHAERWSDRT